MDGNVRIARELARLAKSLVAGQDPYSGMAEQICYGIVDVLVALGDFGVASEPVAFYHGLSDYFHGLEKEFGKGDAVYDSRRLREIKEGVREKAREMSKYSPVGNTAMWRRYGGLRDAYEPYSHHYLRLKRQVLDLMHALPDGGR